jgi:ACT domain-containing protein
LEEKKLIKKTKIKKNKNKIKRYNFTRIWFIKYNNFVLFTTFVLFYLKITKIKKKIKTKIKTTVAAAVF